MKKKILSVVLVTGLVFGLTACGNSNSSEPATEETATEEPTAKETVTEEPTVEPEATQETSADAKTLIVYYSATGTTKGVAEYIAEKTGGDLFELEPVEPYTDEDLDWTDSESRVSVEHDNEDDRNVELKENAAPDFASYDRVYIGYPIWWGIAAWPVDNFVKGNDFTGKTVIPFCTAASSGIGQSGELLKEMAGTGDWVEGEVFRGSASQDDINEWIDSL
ncbi:MAG: flavodoxin [Lachnospiraceae bacterium]|nr:flavodoxin [Lachnospiraceae bacterium]MDD3616704.1 flavodoxin [Lachnospiraceae bacterium]NCB93671.1 flavodoxin [Clostridia bacterium]